MIELKCIKCGAMELEKRNGKLYCPYCGSSFLPDEKEKSVFQAYNPTQTSIDLKSDVEVLLGKCRRDRKNAKKYANLVLDIDPTNEEALKYLK